MTDEQLAEIRTRVEKAASGPWKTCGASNNRCSCGTVFGSGGEAYVCSMTVVSEADPAYTDPQRIDNANFIAHARTDVPLLLDEVDSLRAELKQARDHHQLWVQTFGSSQLTHAKARLEKAESDADRFRTQLQEARAVVKTEE